MKTKATLKTDRKTKADYLQKKKFLHLELTFQPQQRTPSSWNIALHDLRRSKHLIKIMFSVKFSWKNESKINTILDQKIYFF